MYMFTPIKVILKKKKSQLFNYLPVQSQALFDVFIDGNIINEMYRNNGKKPLDSLVQLHIHPILYI